jgi:hypothetical protein
LFLFGCCWPSPAGPYPLHSVSHPADALVGSLIIKFRFSLSATVARERETNSPRFHYWHMSQRGDDLGVCVSTLEARTCLLLPPSCRSVSPRFGRTDGLDWQIEKDGRPPPPPKNADTLVTGSSWNKPYLYWTDEICKLTGSNEQMKLDCCRL